MQNRLEVAVIRQTGFLRAFNVTLLYVSSKLMIFPTLVAFVLLGNELTPEKVEEHPQIYLNISVYLQLFNRYS